MKILNNLQNFGRNLTKLKKKIRKNVKKMKKCKKDID